MTLIVESDLELANALAFALGDGSARVDSLGAVETYLQEHPLEMLVIVGPSVDQVRALAVANTWQVERPSVGMVLLRRRLDVQLMTEALRAGVREVVPADDHPALVAAARRSLDISRRLNGALNAAQGPSARGRVACIFSAKGGSGKTTTATNVAGAFAARGTSVVLVDLDLEFGDVAIALQLVPQRTIVDLVPMLGNMDAQGVRSAITRIDPGLDVLLAPKSPGEATLITPALVTELLSVLRGMYEIVVVDTPPAMTEQVLAAFDSSDQLALLATLDVPSVKNLKVAIETLDLLEYPRSQRIVVLNRADAQVGLTPADVEKAIGTTVGVRVPSSGDVPTSINRGQLIVLQTPHHSVSRAMAELADRLLPVAQAPVAPAAVVAPRRPLRSLLRREAAR